jgi:5'-nucleotidase
MQILVTNDDGPDACGLQALRQAVQAAWPTATMVTLTMDRWLGGLGMSITCRDIDDLPIQCVAPHVYVCQGRPADLVYLALGRVDRFLPAGEFDLVLCGINHGENVGMDVFHSGTVGMAMLASTFYGVPAVAFSQQLPGEMDSEGQDALFRRSQHLVQTFLTGVLLSPGRCLNVNLPATDPRGWQACGVALHSRFRPHKSEERNVAGCDVTELEKGYITMSSLRLGMIGSPVYDAGSVQSF